MASSYVKKRNACMRCHNALSRLVMLNLCFLLFSVFPREDVGVEARKVSSRVTEFDARDAQTAGFDNEGAVSSVLDAFPDIVLKLGGIAKTDAIRNGMRQTDELLASSIDEMVGHMRTQADNDIEKWPVLFVPGLMGSQLEIDLKDRPWSINVFCKRNTKKGDRIHTWLPSLTEVLPFAINCWERNMSLKWNNVTKSVEPFETGVSVHPIQDLEAVINLNENAPVFTWYAYALQQLGYVPDKDMVAFAYDWRLGPESYSLDGGSFEMLKKKIEDTVAANGGRGVVACSISMGGPFFAAFLSSYVNQEWREKYIHGFVSLSGVMSGSSLAPAALVNGYIFHEIPGTIPKYITNLFYSAVLTLPSISWLFPALETFGKEQLIQTPSMAYTPHTFGKMLEDAGQPLQAQFWSMNKGLAGMSLAPHVPTYCLTGFGVPTPNRFIFDKDDFSGIPTIQYSDGDGTVQLSSLYVCDNWKSVQSEPVTPVHFYNTTHTDLLFSIDAIKILMEVATTNVSAVSMSMQ